MLSIAASLIFFIRFMPIIKKMYLLPFIITVLVGCSESGTSLNEKQLKNIGMKAKSPPGRPVATLQFDMNDCEPQFIEKSVMNVLHEMDAKDRVQEELINVLLGQAKRGGEIGEHYRAANFNDLVMIRGVKGGAHS